MPGMASYNTVAGGIGPIQMNNPSVEAANIQSATEKQLQPAQIEAQELPAKLQQQRFNTVWPTIQGAFGRFFNNNPYVIGGRMPQQPTINASPVYSPQQTQQAVNAMRSRNDASTATQIRNNQQSMAGRGFGGNSPLAQALGSYSQAQNLATNTQGEQQLRFNSAQANAQQLLAGQQAQQNQYAQNQGLAIQRAQPYFQMQNALIAALGGLV